MGRPDYILDQFRETAQCRDAQHGGGVCCAFAPQLVHFLFSFLISLIILVIISFSLPSLSRLGLLDYLTLAHRFPF